MQTSQNDQRQLVQELHQNQSVGTSQTLADGSLLIIALILTSVDEKDKNLIYYL